MIYQSMDEYTKLIHELSDLVGIVPEYYDIFGTRHVLSDESRLAILKAMDLEIATPAQVSGEIEKRVLRPWRSVLDPVAVISVNSQPYRLAVHLPMPQGKERTAEAAVIIEDEQGMRQAVSFPAGSLGVDEERLIRDQRFVRTLLALPPLKIGYYRVFVSCSHPEPVFEEGLCSLDRSASLIVAPDACWMPEQLLAGKAWGVALNLYALRSARNWGIGDMTDLLTVVGWASRLQAGLVGINPLHEIPNTAPFGISPYSPVSRLYRNCVYIDIDAVPESSRIRKDTGRIEQLRRSDRIDYQGVAAVKREALEQCFELFYREQFLGDTERGRRFRDYLRREGAALEQHALFLALTERMRSRHEAATWPEWPAEYHAPTGPAVRAFRKEHEKQVLFFSYVQWLIDLQLAEASAAAQAAGMPVGLYGDLAIGAIDSGSDGWMYQDVLAEHATVGVPPDDFNANGQDWGFPPMDPDRLRESGYDLFIRTIRKNMQYMGALRIDHALGLFRLFWIPRGAKPSEGGYVRCNAEDLLRIIALESVRNRTLVIGEDLGTITDEARRRLQEFSILSYRLFYFERNYPDPSFVAPGRYPAMALSAVTTHDLPTLSGYWTGRDVEVKRQAGIMGNGKQYEQQRTDRERDRRLILQALQSQGLLPDPSWTDPACLPSMTPELCRSIYRYLAVSPAKIVLVSLDDIIGTIDQQNLPGTVSEYPNWMQKTPLLLEQIMTDPRWQPLADMFRAVR